jgi:hypothetical protein
LITPLVSSKYSINIKIPIFTEKRVKQDSVYQAYNTVIGCSFI